MGAGKISEDALSCRRGQYRTGDVSALNHALSFVEKEEKRFVLDHRSAQPAAELVPIQVIRFLSAKVCEPGVRVERGIVICPEDAAFELVGAGSGGKLNLAGTAACLGIRRRHDHSDFIDEVRTDISDRIHAVVVPAVLDADSVTRRVDLTGSCAGEIASIGTAGAGRRGDEIQHVPISERQVADFVFRQDSADR